jgi:hypothetical protein
MVAAGTQGRGGGSRAGAGLDGCRQARTDAAAGPRPRHAGADRWRSRDSGGDRWTGRAEAGAARHHCDAGYDTAGPEQPGTRAGDHRCGVESEGSRGRDEQPQGKARKRPPDTGGWRGHGGNRCTHGPAGSGSRCRAEPPGADRRHPGEEVGRHGRRPGESDWRPSGRNSPCSRPPSSSFGPCGS